MNSTKAELKAATSDPCLTMTSNPFINLISSFTHVYCLLKRRVNLNRWNLFLAVLLMFNNKISYRRLLASEWITFTTLVTTKDKKIEFDIIAFLIQFTIG